MENSMKYDANTELGRFPGLAVGDLIEIWYMRREFFRDLSFGDFSAIDPNDLGKTHILLGTIGDTMSLIRTRIRYGSVDQDKTLSHVWTSMQGEMWSPNGEANHLVLGRGLGHTSMSVGDIIRFKDGNHETLVCQNIGWKRI